jgi:DNA polymerase III subunit gamma/tau
VTYEPLHHKYRPQTFAQLVGQEAIAATLSNALRQQRIAPAYLFTGARGTGKTSSARILAKSLNCIQGNVPTEQPCGVCEVCRTITNGSALDVIEIDAASNTGVDNIRELIERSQFAPVQCRYKVYVVDECHMLSTAAFNALLKTLEEPPAQVVFVLATTDPQRVLPTIISRCQRFDFRRIPLESLTQHLTYIASKEAIDIADDAIQLVGQISLGGMRDAESLLDQLSLVDGQITVERVWDLVGAVPEKDLLTLVKAIAQDDSTVVLDQTRHLMDRGREPLIVLQNLASFYRDLLIAKTTPDRADLVAITAPTWKELCAFAATLDIRTILQGQQLLRTSEVQVKNSTQPRLWLEITLLGLLPSAMAGQVSAAPPSRSISSPVPSPIPSPVPALIPQPIPAPIPQSIPTPIPQPVPTPTPQPIPTPVPEPIPQPIPEPEPIPEPAAIAPEAGQSLDEIWADVLQRVQPYSTRVMMSQQCQLLGIEAHEVRMGARSEQLFKMAKDRMPNIEIAFQEYLARKVKVTLEVISAAAITAPPKLPNPPPAPPPAPPSRPSVQESAPPFPTPKPSDSQPNHSQSNHSQPPPPPPTPPGTGIAPPAAIPPIEPPPLEPSPLEPSPIEPPIAPHPAWQSDDDVTRSTKSFAQFFNGQIVNWEDPPSGDQVAADPSLNLGLDLTADASTPVDELDSDPDSDVPF